jgi:hypothetical protein
MLLEEITIYIEDYDAVVTTLPQNINSITDDFLLFYGMKGGPASPQPSNPVS